MSDHVLLNQVMGALTRAFPELVIQAGACEPFYQAPKNGQCAMLFFREDFIRSLLHEMAHYCLAGDRRRQLDDFGYWYVPCGRTAEEQAQFEQAEVRPQALEWIFCDSLGIPFQPSLDDFSGRPISPRFLENLKHAYMEFQEKLPPTAQRALEGLKADVLATPMHCMDSRGL